MRNTRKLKNLWLIGTIVLFASCINQENKKYSEISDFVTKKEYVIDTTLNVTRDVFFGEFDTVPSAFGYKIFNDIFHKIPIESSKFKQLWAWNIDTIKTVLACRKNNILDRQDELSLDSYFFYIDFITVDSIPIGGTIYTDFKRNMIGTYVIVADTVKFDTIKNIKLEHDEYLVHRLKNRLRIKTGN